VKRVYSSIQVNGVDTGNNIDVSVDIDGINSYIGTTNFVVATITIDIYKIKD
jgi:hypothetical protein